MVAHCVMHISSFIISKAFSPHVIFCPEHSLIILGLRLGDTRKCNRAERQHKLEQDIKQACERIWLLRCISYLLVFIQVHQVACRSCLMLSLWIKGVDHNLLGAFNFSSAEWATMSIRVLFR